MTYAIIYILLACGNPDMSQYSVTRDDCRAAVEAARHDPDLSYFVAMIEENA